MNIVYQIIVKGERSYAANIEACDKACAIIIKNGYIPVVNRIPKSKVPMEDLDMITNL